MWSIPTPEQMREIIQARMIRARLHAGRTQAEMAKLLGVPLERYCKWENRRRSVLPPEYADLFCTITNMPVRDLFTTALDANDRAVIGWRGDLDSQSS